MESLSDDDALSQVMLQQQRIRDHLDQFVLNQELHVQQHRRTLEAHLAMQRLQVEELRMFMSRDRLSTSDMGEVMLVLDEERGRIQGDALEELSNESSGICLESAAMVSETGTSTKPPDVFTLQRQNATSDLSSFHHGDGEVIMLGNDLVCDESPALPATVQHQDKIVRMSRSMPSWQNLAKILGNSNRSDGKSNTFKRLSRRLRGEDSEPWLVRPKRTSHVEASQRLHSAYTQAARIINDEDPDGEAINRQSRVTKAHNSLKDRSQLMQKALMDNSLLRMTRIETFVESKHFKLSIVAAIVLNAIFIGFTTDWSIRSSVETFNNPQVNDQYADILKSDPLFLTEAFFNSVFTLELLARVLAQEGRFLCGPESYWNLFDTVVVALSILEMSLLVVGFSSSYIRVLRLARVLRSMRMLRLVRFLSLFNKLHAVSLAFARCRTMLICGVLCLFLVVFCFSVIFASAVAAHVSDAQYPDTNVEEILVFFGSLPMTMLTLFMAVSGGVDWWDICRLLMVVGTGYVMVFLVFIVITVLAVLNVINAIFVNDAVEATQHDLDLRSSADLQETKTMLKRLTNIFFEMGKDKETVSLDVFLRHMEHEEMKMHLSLIGVHFCDGVALFRFLDVDRTGFLTIEQFVMGCLRLKGEAILIEMDNSLRQTKDMLMDIQDTLVTALTDHRRSGAESSTSTDFCSVPGDSCQRGEASAHQTSVSICAVPERFEI